MRLLSVSESNWIRNHWARHRPVMELEARKHGWNVEIFLVKAEQEYRERMTRVFLTGATEKQINYNHLDNPMLTKAEFEVLLMEALRKRTVQHGRQRRALAVRL